MAAQRTFSIIKPDAVEKNKIGAILHLLEDKGFRIVAMQKKQLSKAEAEGFYAVHKERPFFGELVEFITSGPLVAAVLEGHEAVKAARQVIGATNPIEAATGSIRGDYALEVGQNMVHGSDSDESAAREAAIFFPNL